MVFRGCYAKKVPRDLMVKMDTDEIRRLILLELLEERFGSRKDGVAKLADTMGMASSQIRRTLNPNKPSYRNIGRVLARRIEDALGLESGHMDNVRNLKSVIPCSSADENASLYTAPRPRNPPILGNTDKGCTMRVPQAVELIDVPSNDPDAYGLRVVRTIANRYLAGEVLLIEPNEAIDPGETVVVITKENEFLIRGLVSKIGAVTTLCELDNMNARTQLRADEIKQIHLVAGCFIAKKIKQIAGPVGG